MKELSYSELKDRVGAEYVEVVNVHKWYVDQETGFAFRIVGKEGGLEYLHNFLARRAAHWADDE